MIHQTAAPTPPPIILVPGVGTHLALGRLDTEGRRGFHLFGKGDAAALLENCGRQFGGGGRRAGWARR